MNFEDDCASATAAALVAVPDGDVCALFDPACGRPATATVSDARAVGERGLIGATLNGLVESRMPGQRARPVREAAWRNGPPKDRHRAPGRPHNLVYDRAFLMHAWERVSSNAGARTPGVDRATVARIEAQVGVVAFLEGIRESLKSGEFRPVEVRQVMIPKGSSGKLRSLGIPTVVDRVVQTALKAVLEPVFEADFLPVPNGFG